MAGQPITVKGRSRNRCAPQLNIYRKGVVIATTSPSSLRLKFFDYLFGEQEGFFCVATSHFLRGKFQQSFYEWPNQKSEITNFIDSRSKDHNIWFGVNLLRAAERVKINCLPSGIVWADLDFIDPTKIDPLPTCVIESSPKRYQGFWRLESIVPPDVAEDYSKRVTYSTGADRSGWPLTKLLRVPHTLNFKYENPPEIRVLKALETRVPLGVFEELPVAFEEHEKKDWELVTQGTDTPNLDDLPNLDQIIYKYKHQLSSDGNAESFVHLMNNEPAGNADWSALLWRLINICAETGMDREEAFAVAYASKCNKYARDNRPISHLWREVCKAFITHEKIAIITADKFTALTMPQLVDPDKIVEDSFVVDYKKWGDAVTDAPEEYHELACFVALSALTSSGMRLDTTYGEVVPNIWGLVLGESTLTRKTTAMRMAMDIVTDIDEQIILATDGSPEGLLSGLSNRPQRVSVFYKDEVSGFFDSINRKDYLAGMPEVLTQLYDVPKVLRRLLKKETITITEPYFIFFGGGIRDKVYSLVSEEYILSGFLPRFLVVSGENDMERVRPTGPATGDTIGLKQKVITTFGDLKIAYNVSTPVEVAGQHMLMPARVSISLTEDAWQFFAGLEMRLINEANSSPHKLLALPVFQRLAKSILKISMLISATRREPKENSTMIVDKSDITQAAYYIQKWGRHSIDLIANAGKPDIEKKIDRVLRYIIEFPGSQRREITRQFSLVAKEMNDLEETMIMRGLIYVEKKGREKRYYPV